MKILVLTYGTRGDVQPLISLCKELTKAGHSVTLATAARFEALATAHDVHFSALSDELLGTIDTQ
ncbi:glycosyltransferase [uncultured Ruegeria sp.]|uniref:glycosyltransferase n=1 Tax=uncultured Ruegeria sp. TaxID=259304 RepID=UPI002606A166|nr:glycosyltransferase [uncultured Ruegeria sp.]